VCIISPVHTKLYKGTLRSLNLTGNMLSCLGIRTEPIEIRHHPQAVA
jgi:hypothetical protein